MHLALTAFAVRVAAHPDPDLISEARALMSAARQAAPASASGTGAARIA